MVLTIKSNLFPSPGYRSTVGNGCPVCRGRGAVTTPAGIDACSHCAALAEAEWRGDADGDSTDA